MSTSTKAPFADYVVKNPLDQTERPFYQNILKLHNELINLVQYTVLPRPGLNPYGNDPSSVAAQESESTPATNGSRQVLRHISLNELDNLRSSWPSAKGSCKRRLPSRSHRITTKGDNSHTDLHRTKLAAHHSWSSHHHRSIAT